MKIEEVIYEDIIDEAGLNRIVDLSKDKDFAMISAFMTQPSSPSSLSNMTPEQWLQHNRNNNKLLMADIRANGLGFHKMIGHWGGSKEESFFVIKNKELTSEAFKNLMIRLANKYNQEGLLIKTDKNMQAIDLIKNTTENLKGTVSFDNLGQTFSQYIKTLDKPFKFEDKNNEI